MLGGSAAVTSFLQLKKERRTSRFSLLFLDYNEFLLQDLAVYKYDAPTPELSWYVAFCCYTSPIALLLSFYLIFADKHNSCHRVRCSQSRVGGRLKVCTRGLIFEPTSDAGAPIVRFPYKAMVSPLAPYNLAPGSAAATSVDPATLFTFTSKLCVDLEVVPEVGVLL